MQGSRVLPSLGAIVPKPEGVPKPRPSIHTLYFSGKETQEFLKEQAFQKECREKCFAKSYYQEDGVSITGEDVLRALKKAGYKRLLNPVYLLNPFSWLAKTSYALKQDGYSQRVPFHMIVQNLPIANKKRTEKQQRILNENIGDALYELMRTGAIEYYSKRTSFLEVETWRPLRAGNQLLRKGVQKSPNASGQNLQENLEGALQRLEKEKKQRKTALQHQFDRVAAEENKLTTLSAALEELQKKPVSDLTSDMLFERTLKAQEVAQKKELLEALRQHNLVTQALLDKQNEETNQVLLKIRQALHQITLTTVRTETLTQTHQLKEKAELEKVLATQLADAQVAYETIRQALEAENPGQFIALMQKVRKLYQKLEAESATTSPAAKAMGQIPEDLLLRLQKENMAAGELDQVTSALMGHFRSLGQR